MSKFLIKNTKILLFVSDYCGLYTRNRAKISIKRNVAFLIN